MWDQILAVMFLPAFILWQLVSHRREVVRRANARKRARRV